MSLLRLTSLSALTLCALSLCALPQAEAAKSTEAVVSVLEALSDTQHECQAVIKELNNRLEAAPDDLLALLARGECLYRVGRMQQARSDLEVVFAKDTPDKVGMALRKELSSGEVAFMRALDGYTLLGVLAADQGDLPLAAKVSERLPALEKLAAKQGGLAETGTRQPRVDAHIAHAKGQRAQAWSRVDQLLTMSPEDSHTSLAATELASLDPDHVSEKAMTLISAPARTNRAYNRGVAALNSGQWTACLTELDGMMAEQQGPALRRFQELAYPCAVQAGDLDRAAAIAETLGGIPAERTDAALAHAEKLQQAGRDDEAAAILDATQPRNAEEEGIRATLLVRIHTKAGRLDEAVEASGEGQVRPATLANLALSLKKAERVKEARAVLAPACPEMSGQDAARCYDLLKRLGG